MNAKVSLYIDEMDVEYNMIELYYNDFFVYMIDYDHVEKDPNNYDLEVIYKNIEFDIMHHAIPCLEFRENAYLVDYSYYIDFHPKKA